MDIESLIENVANALTAGVTIGCIYGLMCIGLGLIFGIMKVVNFAQGEILMLGMFASLYLVTGGGVLAFLGPYVGPFVGAILAGPIIFVVGALIHKFLISRVSGLKTAGSIDDGHFGQLIVTLGISLILQNGGMIVFGSTPFTVRTPLSSSAIEVGLGIGDASVFLNKAKLIACAVAIVTALALYMTMEFTRIGKALRATAMNRVGARLMGIPTELSGDLSFALAALIGGVSGLLIAPLTTVYYDTGFLIGLKGFVAAIIGGLISYPLALAGALLVGLLESFSSFWASAFKEVIVFTLIIPVLLWRSLNSHHVEDEE